jgi:hypothetical protein
MCVKHLIILPHPSTLRKWISTVDSSARFTKEAFKILSIFKAENKMLVCGLIYDEMSPCRLGGMTIPTRAPNKVMKSAENAGEKCYMHQLSVQNVMRYITKGVFNY